MVDSLRKQGSLLFWCIKLEINVVKLLRAHGGCLGVRRKSVEGCEKPGGAVKQALIPGYSVNVGN